MLYFFHISVDGFRSDDLEGREFGSYEEAFADAVENGRAVIVDLVRQGRFLSGADVIEVVDATGHKHATLSLESLIKRDLPSSSHAQNRPTLADAVRTEADQLLRQCLEVSKTQLGHVQIVDWHKGQLSICAHQGLDSEFLDQFRCVDMNSDRACTAAMRGKAPLVVDDVSAEPFPKQCAEVLERAGVNAFQSTPLLSCHGLLVGIVSTYFNTRGRLSDLQMQEISTAAGKTADAILKLRAAVET